MDIRHHPADELLLAHATGRLATGHRLVVASHVELCMQCREQMRALEAAGGVLLEELPPVPVADDALARLMARIDALEAHDSRAGDSVRKVSGPPPLPPGVDWPRALAHCTATRWRWLGPGMRWSRVSVPDDPAANVFLLRIAAGKYLPQHTHTDLEMTQILHGRFHDGRALFAPGDFDAADGDIHHQPVVQDGSECICLAAVEGRLRFDGFIARRLGALVGM